MSKSLFQIWIHAIWTVKNRAPALDKSFRYELFHHIKISTREKDIYIDTINGVEDHVHCLFMLKSTQTVAKVLKEIKGESSRWINERNLIGGHFEWQRGYGAFSVSPNVADKVRNYVYNQEKHHQTMGFEEEMKRFEEILGADLENEEDLE
jgi:putative transposase